MKKYILGAAAFSILAVATLTAGAANAAQGSGKSADNRNDDFVVVCHYDRNLKGPNAGPHTITINANALDKHLENHVKAEGFIGDDHVGACGDDIVIED